MNTDRTYFILLLGILGAVSIINTAIPNSTVAAYAKSLGADEGLAGFIVGLYSIVAIPASILVGMAIDMIGRKRALVLGLGLTSFWIYGYAAASNPFSLIIFRILHAITGSLVFPATIAMIADVSKEKTGRRMGIYWIIIGIALTLGSFLAALLVTTLGFRLLYMVVVVISLAGTIISLIPPETAGKAIMPKTSLKIIAASIKKLSIAYVSIFSLYVAFGVIVGSLALVLISAGLETEKAAGAVGIYLGLATLTSLPIFYIVAKTMDKIGPIKFLILGIIFAALSQFLLATSISHQFIYTSSIILGIAIAMVYTTSTAVAAMPEARGSSVGIHQTANIAGVALGASVSGLLLQYYGASAPFYLAVAVQIITLVLIMVLRKAK